MKTGIVAGLLGATIAAAALSTASVAIAAPSLASHEMKTALAKAEEGPTALRRYVERTKPIYHLDYFEVMRIHEARKLAQRQEEARIAASNAKK